ncbi:MAG: RdgB/HAM1 family non-canonical purine NTP pyrophosphatase [Bacillota bacterium]
MKLIIASNNAHKVREIKQILDGFFDRMVTLKEAGLEVDVVEDADSFEGNALKKAREVLLVSDADAALSDDSGLAVDALGGAPGVYSARFAGEGHDDEKNNFKLLSLMVDVPDRDRGCRFVSAVALAFRDGREFCVRGECEGRLLWAPVGSNGFGYDPLFFHEGFQKSFAQLTAEEKNSVSHRRAALERLKAALEAAGIGCGSAS